MIGKLLLALSATGAGLAWYSARSARLMEARVPADGQFVDVDGARLHYVDLGPGHGDRGQAPTLVMVHGLCGQMRNFTYALAERMAERYRVIVVDRPGSGYSAPAPGKFPGLQDQARLIARFIDTLKLDRPLLVGHSLGGAVSLALGMAHPQQVRGLALIAPLTHPVQTPPKAFASLAIPPVALRRLVAWTLAVPLGQLIGDKGLRQAFAPDPVPADFAIRGGAELAMRPDNFFAAASDLFSANAEMSGLVARYPALALPVEVIYGRQDRILDYHVHGEGLANTIPTAKLTLVDGGHMLPVTHVEAVADWLDHAWGRASG